MSRENVEIARRAMDALNQSDLMVGGGDPLPTLREFCDPDVEWDFSRRGVDPEIYHGYEGWLRIAQQFGDAWQELRLEIEEIIDAGDNEAERTEFHVWTVESGAIVGFHWFTSTETLSTPWGWRGRRCRRVTWRPLSG